MAKNENRRIRPQALEADEVAFNALQKINGYVPSNPAYALATISQVFDEMRAAQVVENQLTAALATARDIANSKEWAVHNMMLGVKDQVTAQYGKDSLQLQELGLKRKSEYKSKKPGSKTPAKLTNR
jgi:hypothetical protein